MKNPEYLKLANCWAKYWAPFINDLFSNRHNEAGLCLLFSTHNVDREIDAVREAMAECGVVKNDGDYWFRSRAHRANFLLLLAAENGEL